MNIITKTYALRTFGIELREPKLTYDEEVLLMRIKYYIPPLEIKQDFSDVSGKSWEIDIEFSELCIEGSGWK